MAGPAQQMQLYLMSAEGVAGLTCCTIWQEASRGGVIAQINNVQNLHIQQASFATF